MGLLLSPTENDIPERTYYACHVTFFHRTAGVSDYSIPVHDPGLGNGLNVCRARGRYLGDERGLQIHADVKHLTLKDESEPAIKRYQYTAIDNATRTRALRYMIGNNQTNAIDLIDYMIGKLFINCTTKTTSISRPS